MQLVGTLRCGRADELVEYDCVHGVLIGDTFFTTRLRLLNEFYFCATLQFSRSVKCTTAALIVLSPINTFGGVNINGTPSRKYHENVFGLTRFPRKKKWMIISLTEQIVVRRQLIDRRLKPSRARTVNYTSSLC